MLNYRLYIVYNTNTVTKLQVLQILLLEPLLYVLNHASSTLNACLDLDTEYILSLNSIIQSYLFVWIKAKKCYLQKKKEREKGKKGRERERDPCLADKSNGVGTSSLAKCSKRRPHHYLKK